MSVEILKIPCISTAHLDEATADALDVDPTGNPWCPCASWDFGFFICTVWPYDNARAPKCLRDIKDWYDSLPEDEAMDGWVRLDRDADPVPGLPVYDW